jgi:hypothetical protein
MFIHVFIAIDFTGAKAAGCCNGGRFGPVNNTTDISKLSRCNVTKCENIPCSHEYSSDCFDEVVNFWLMLCIRRQTFKPLR